VINGPTSSRLDFIFSSNAIHLLWTLIDGGVIAAIAAGRCPIGRKCAG
jgi:hypothetical protein